MKLTAQAASPADAEAVAMIYNEGIADRIGTFETEPRRAAQIAAWFDGRHPIIVVEEGKQSGGQLGAAKKAARPHCGLTRRIVTEWPRPASGLGEGALPE